MIRVADSVEVDHYGVCLSLCVRTSLGRLPLIEANHRSTPASAETSNHAPSTVAMFRKSRPVSAMPTPASLSESHLQADSSHTAVRYARPALGPRISSHVARSDTHTSSFVDLTSEPSNGCDDSSKAG